LIWRGRCLALAGSDKLGACVGEVVAASGWSARIPLSYSIQ
jgi:hypothetical protein